MKIGVDITMLVYAGSGVANYTFNLVKNLLKIDNTNEYRLFYSSLRRPKKFYYINELRKLGAKVYAFRFPPTLLQIWWGKFHIFPVEWFIGKVDVFFLSDFLRPPLLKGTIGITTVHDLTWKLFPEYHEQRIVDAHERKLEKTIKYNDGIIVDSQNTKKDLLKLYPKIKENKVHVIYPGISEYFKPINDQNKINKVLSKYLDSEFLIHNSKFLLYVGAIEPRKNLDISIKVFNELIKDQKFKDYKFLIVGRAGWKNEKIFRLIDQLHLKEKVKFVGFVEDEDLPYFYSGCLAFVYLSKYEGFGLPPVEAAYCGKMVLMYDNSSLKEIFKPGYPFTEEGKELGTLKEILEGKHDVKKYLKNFSWKFYCQRFLKILKSL